MAATLNRSRETARNGFCADNHWMSIVAARLEVETKRFGLPLLIGPATAAAAASLSPTPVGHVRQRGRGGMVEVFTLGRVAAPGLRVRSV